MNILFLILILTALGKTGKDRRGSDLFKIIIGFYLLSFVIGLFVRLPFIPLAIVGLIAWGIFQAKKQSDRENFEKRMSGREEERKANKNPYSSAGRWENAGQVSAGQQSTYGGDGWQRASSGSGASSTGSRTRSSILPHPMKKRTRLVSEFNEKYKLTLTEEEIKRIVEASYMSESWKREVESMAARYETVHEWFYGDTSWLRVYIYAFEVQNISSDFELQERYAEEAFDEVFRYAESMTYLTLPERIARVNDRFFATFDEASFMIAYRYMEKKGKKYDLGSGAVLKNEDEAEQAMHKYATM